MTLIGPTNRKKVEFENRERTALITLFGIFG